MTQGCVGPQNDASFEGEIGSLGHEKMYENVHQKIFFEQRGPTIWVFPKIWVPGTPKWKIYKENPIKMDDLGVPLFLETSLSYLTMVDGFDVRTISMTPI